MYMTCLVRACSSMHPAPELKGRHSDNDARVGWTATGTWEPSRHQPWMGVMPAREMLNPWPSVTVQTMAATVERQLKGPAPVESPYANVGVFNPALLPHCMP